MTSLDPNNLYTRKGPPNRGDDPFLRRLGARVRKLREQAELSQMQLAERVSRSQVWVSRIERGHYDMPVSALVLLARALRTTVVALVAT